MRKVENDEIVKEIGEIRVVGYRGEVEKGIGRRRSKWKLLRKK